MMSKLIFMTPKVYSYDTRETSPKKSTISLHMTSTRSRDNFKNSRRKGEDLNYLEEGRP